MAGQSAAVTENRVSVGLGDVGEVRLSVAVLDFISILTMVVDSIAGIRRGLAEPWRASISGAVSGAGHDALRPIGADPSRGWVPDCLTPLGAFADPDLSVCLQQLRAADATQIGSNLAAEFGETPAQSWQSAMARPSSWMAASSDAVEAVAQLTRPLLAQARPLYDREIERIGVASVRGGTAALLGNLNSRISYRDNTLTFSHPVAGAYDLGGRELVLVPMVTGDRMLMTNLEDPDRVWIGYPLPGAGHLWQETFVPQLAATDPLIALLGGTRAAVLMYLNRSATMGELAAAAGCTLTQAGLHCTRLVEANLIERHRHGRQVRVNRTEAGSRLLDIYRAD